MQDINSYIHETKRQLEDTNFYEKLTINPTLEYNTKINRVIDDIKEQNPEKTANSLKLENPKTPKFYTSPKIHKPGNPERPVFNSLILTQAIYLSLQTIIHNHTCTKPTFVHSRFS